MKGKDKGNGEGDPAPAGSATVEPRKRQHEGHFAQTPSYAGRLRGGATEGGHDVDIARSKRTNDHLIEGHSSHRVALPQASF